MLCQTCYITLKSKFAIKSASKLEEEDDSKSDKSEDITDFDEIPIQLNNSSGEELASELEQNIEHVRIANEDESDSKRSEERL